MNYLKKKLIVVCSTFIAHIMNLALMMNNNNKIFLNSDLCSPNDFINVLTYNKVIKITNKNFLDIPDENINIKNVNNYNIIPK